MLRLVRILSGCGLRSRFDGLFRMEILRDEPVLEPEVLSPKPGTTLFYPCDGGLGLSLKAGLVTPSESLKGSK